MRVISARNFILASIRVYRMDAVIASGDGCFIPKPVVRLTLDYSRRFQTWRIVLTCRPVTSYILVVL